MAIRLGNRGGRPPRSQVAAHFEGAPDNLSIVGTWSQIIEGMIVMGHGFWVECPPERRRAVRASIRTTALRLGARVKTHSTQDRLWVEEVK